MAKPPPVLDADGNCTECGQRHVGLRGPQKGKQTCVRHTNGRDGTKPLMPCRKGPCHGMDVCASHGASTPASKAIRQRHHADVEAERELRRLAKPFLTVTDVPPVTDPVDLLARVAAQSDHFVNALSDMVNALDGNVHTTAFGVENVRAVVGLYERALDRTLTAADKLAKLGYKEKRLQFDRDMAAVMLGVIQRVLALIPDPALRGQVTDAMVIELRALEQPPDP